MIIIYRYILSIKRSELLIRFEHVQILYFIGEKVTRYNKFRPIRIKIRYDQ